VFLLLRLKDSQDGDSIDQGIILRAFKLSDTQIITPLKTYNFKQETDEEYMEFGLFMSRREYKIISKRLLRGRNLSAKEGKFVGSHPPYGYEREKLNHQKGYTLKANKEKADIVKLIFDMYANNLNKVTDIGRHLNSLSILSPSNSKWTTDGIRRILKNPVYAGFIKYNSRTTTTSIKNGKMIKQSTKNDGSLKELIFVKGLHEPIISEELFYKSLDIMKSNYIPPTNKPLTNALAGLIRCKTCGKIMTSNISHGDRRLYCKTLDCTNKGVNFYQVENEIINFLKQWLNSKDIIYSNDNKNVIDSKMLLLENANNQLKKQELKKDNIYNLFEDGIYDKDIFIERNSKIISSIDNLKMQIKILNEEISKLKEIEREKQNFIPTLKKVLENYEKTTNTQEKNYLLKSVINEIYYLKTDAGSRWQPAKFKLWIMPKILHD